MLVLYLPRVNFLPHLLRVGVFWAAAKCPFFGAPFPPLSDVLGEVQEFSMFTEHPTGWFFQESWSPWIVLYHSCMVLVTTAGIVAITTQNTLWGTCLSGWLHKHTLRVLPFATLHVSFWVEPREASTQLTTGDPTMPLPKTAWPHGKLLSVLQGMKHPTYLEKILLWDHSLHPDMLIKDNYCS